MAAALQLQLQLYILAFNKCSSWREMHGQGQDSSSLFFVVFERVKQSCQSQNAFHSMVACGWLLPLRLPRPCMASQNTFGMELAFHDDLDDLCAAWVLCGTSGVLRHVGLFDAQLGLERATVGQGQWRQCCLFSCCCNSCRGRCGFKWPGKATVLLLMHSHVPLV